MKELTGSEKQVNWANQIRDRKMREAASLLKREMTGNETAEHNFSVLESITEAKFWIETKNVSAKGLLRYDGFVVSGSLNFKKA